MKLIIGLGNPGQKYQNTRHNFGFFVIEKAHRYFQKNDYKFSDFEFDTKSNAKISKGQIGGEKIFLVMPQTFMNDSGQSVQKLVQFYKLAPEKDILVIYDDIDLPFSAIRTKGEGAAGHKGMQSIIDVLGTKKIPRVRLGIFGKPKNEINSHTFSQNTQKSIGIKDAAAYVLEKFSSQELKIILKEILPQIISKIEDFLKS
jgi:PTH1 family peptidyl-tRNA hydrolase